MHVPKYLCVDTKYVDVCQYVINIKNSVSCNTMIAPIFASIHKPWINSCKIGLLMVITIVMINGTSIVSISAYSLRWIATL